MVLLEILYDTLSQACELINFTKGGWLFPIFLAGLTWVRRRFFDKRAVSVRDLVEWYFIWLCVGLAVNTISALAMWADHQLIIFAGTHMTTSFLKGLTALLRLNFTIFIGTVFGVLIAYLVDRVFMGKAVEVFQAFKAHTARVFCITVAVSLCVAYTH